MQSWRGLRISQHLTLSKADVLNFIVLTAWTVELIVVFCVAVGLINPTAGSVQAMLINAIVGSFVTISATALGVYVKGKSQTLDEKELAAIVEAVSRIRGT